MQRRLTIALIGMTLAAIVFVGAGVLGFAQIGAEREARDLVEDQLEALVGVVENSQSLEQAGPALVRVGEAFDLSSVRFGVLLPNGEIRFGRRGPDGPAPVEVKLDAEETALLQSGEPLITREDGRIRGVELISTSLDRNLQANSLVMIERNIATVANQARLWFVLSGVIVLIGAAIVAAWLARKFTAPVRTATATAAAIAGGDLSARMPVEGDDELAALGEGINTMASELERGRAAEQQFLLSISHDLRTPLTAIGGYAEALEDGAVADTERVGTILQTHAGRLDRLVGDLLDLAKLEARQFRFELGDVDAAAVARLVAGGHGPDASNRALSIDVDAGSDCWIHADSDRLAQIIGNLIDNAAKFAASTITVDVHQQTTAGGPPRVLIAVADDGPGIAPEDLPHVFERLYVTKQTPVRAESSSGLGLAIVRELANAMGGSVSASSTLGRGTRMEVDFPFSDRPEVTETSTPAGS